MTDFQNKHAESLARMAATPAGKVLVAHVTVGDETMTVKVEKIHTALFNLAGSPLPGLQVNAKIEIAVMTEAEFAAIPEYQ